MKLCPYCAEEIQDAAIVCRYCGCDLEQAAQPTPTQKEEPKTGMKTSFKALLAIAVVLIFGCVLLLNTGGDSGGGSSNEPDTVRLICQECADEGIAINLWDSPKRGKITGTIWHNTEVIYLDSEVYDGRTFYRVALNGVRGWVPEDFVRK